METNDDDDGGEGRDDVKENWITENKTYGRIYNRRQYCFLYNRIENKAEWRTRRQENMLL